MSAKWLPLESNPDVMNKFIHELGVPKDWSVVDLVGLDDELLATVPSPVLAVLLLYPSRKQNEAGVEMAKASGQSVSDQVYFLQQTIRNACGTVALLNAIANSADHIKLGNGSTIAKFLNETKSLSPEERGKHLEQEESISAIHEMSAREGQTQTPCIDDEVDFRFMTLVEVDGNLYELDGRKSLPVNHGPTSRENLLKDAASVCRKFIERDPENVRFHVLALAAAAN
ncbi:ubiquitin carboxyl-terminal hydrolase isozyme L3-like [Tachypleus tridentatus]|uniref:ubiquitin carboxyl-terminal hydrolase isozyme L3-like n=1 Tax=Tachypleus tridentatus TaxID=6853 RepID=UPI003FD5744A